MGYIEFNVGFHGQDGDVESIKKRLKQAIHKEFDNTSYCGLDLDVEIAEHTTDLECEECKHKDDNT